MHDVDGMALVRSLTQYHGPSVTMAQIEAERLRIEEIAALVPIDRIKERLRTDMSSMGDELREMAALLRSNPPGDDLPPGLDVEELAKDVEDHADDPPSEEDIEEEAISARFEFTRAWINAMIVASSREAAPLDDRLAPLKKPGLWKKVQRQTHLDDRDGFRGQRAEEPPAEAASQRRD